MKGVIRSIKNEINNYDEGERLVRELTSNERTPPSTQMLIKLKIMLQDQYQFPTIVRMLFKRLKDYNNIRHVEKSLICIEYLLKNADRKFVRYCQMDKKSISKLQRYRYILGNNNGVPVDYGGNIRKRAKRITDLLDKEDKLKAKRAEAQGYSMKFSNATTGSYKPKSNKKSSTKSSTKKSSKSTKTDSKKKKKKKPKKKKENKEETETGPTYESFIDVPADTNNGQSGFESGGGQQGDDLLSGNWWQQEDADPFNGNNEEEFEWFQGGDDNGAQTGTGDDGGAFGFGNEDDFKDEDQKEDALDADSWMTSLTTMDNVLDGSIQKKDTNKRNTKGTSMAAMAAKNPSKQPIQNSFGTDAFFDENSGNNNKNNNNGTGDGWLGTWGSDNNNNNNGGSAASNITSLYNQQAPKPNPFGVPQQNNGFGYQGKMGGNGYNNDIFAGIGSGGGGGVGPQPAKYVPRQKQADPFAQFGMNSK